jgi:hypothetical protein
MAVVLCWLHPIGFDLFPPDDLTLYVLSRLGSALNRPLHAGPHVQSSSHTSSDNDHTRTRRNHQREIAYQDFFAL